MQNLLYFQKDAKKLKSAGGITIRFHRAGWGESEIAIEAHCDTWNIEIAGWIKPHIGIFGFIRAEVSAGNKDKSHLGCAPISRASGRSLGVETSSDAWEIQSASRGFGTARLLISILSELLFGNGNIDIVKRMRNDNSIVV